MVGSATAGSDKGREGSGQIKIPFTRLFSRERGVGGTVISKKVIGLSDPIAHNTIGRERSQVGLMMIEKKSLSQNHWISETESPLREGGWI